MKIINKDELRLLVLDGISTEELKQYDYSHISDMSNMFWNCTSLESIPLLDTSNVTNMNGMFNGATTFNQFLLGWCVTGITTLPTDFDTDSALTPANLPNWGVVCD